MQKNLSMKNLIEVRLWQIGEQFINKETAIKCSQILTEFLEKYAPTEKKLVSNLKRTTSEKPWVTKEILHLVAVKHRYFKDYKLIQIAESFVSFKKYRNFVNRKLKKHKINIQWIF